MGPNIGIMLEAQYFVFVDVVIVEIVLVFLHPVLQFRQSFQHCNHCYAGWSCRPQMAEKTTLFVHPQHNTYIHSRLLNCIDIHRVWRNGSPGFACLIRRQSILFSNPWRSHMRLRIHFNWIWKCYIFVINIVNLFCCCFIKCTSFSILFL